MSELLKREDVEHLIRSKSTDDLKLIRYLLDELKAVKMLSEHGHEIQEVVLNELEARGEA